MATSAIGYKTCGMATQSSDAHYHTYDSVGNRRTQKSMVKGREPALSGGEVSAFKRQEAHHERPGALLFLGRETAFCHLST
jgi:hypothetical protein